MRTLGALVRACHPGPTVAVTSIALLMGVSVQLSPTLLAIVGVTVLVGQLSIGWSNDWLDAARDVAAERSDKPTATGKVTPVTLRLASFWSAGVSVPLSLIVGWSGAWHLLLVVSGWAYNLGVKRSPWSPLPYALGFGALPIYVTAVAEQKVQWWLPVAGGLLGVAAHFANAAPDVAQDRELGVLGLPQRIGARGSLVVALVILGCAGGLLLTQGGLSGWGLALGGVLVALPVIAGSSFVMRGRIDRPAFTVVMVAAVVDVALLVIAA